MTRNGLRACARAPVCALLVHRWQGYPYSCMQVGNFAPGGPVTGREQRHRGQQGRGLPERSARPTGRPTSGGSPELKGGVESAFNHFPTTCQRFAGSVTWSVHTQPRAVWYPPSLKRLSSVSSLWRLPLDRSKASQAQGAQHSTPALGALARRCTSTRGLAVTRPRDAHSERRRGDAHGSPRQK